MVEIGANLSGDITAGLDKLEAKIRGEVLLSGVAAMANVVYQEVLLNAGRHVKTGTLRDAVYRAYSPEKSDDVQQVYHVGVNRRKAPHFHFLEFGTSRQPATPIVRPALDHMGQAATAGTQRIKERLEGGA